MAAAAARLKRSYKDQEWREPGEGYNGEEPQKGLYPMKLVNVEEHVTQNGDESIHWVFEMTADAGRGNDSYEGWRGHIYTNDNSTAWKEQQVLVALGAIQPRGSINMTLDALLKKFGKVTVMGRVLREKYIPEDGDGEGEWKAKLQSVLKSRDAVGPKRKGRDADDDDEDEPFVSEEDEDDEEEAPPKRSTRSRRKAEPEPEEDEEEDEEEDDEEVDPDELAEELEALSLAALKKRAREEYSVKVVRGMDADAIIDAILETLEDQDDDEDDEEEEEEPEPPKRGRRAAVAKPATGTGRRRTGKAPF